MILGVSDVLMTNGDDIHVFIFRSFDAMFFSSDLLSLFVIIMALLAMIVLLVRLIMWFAK